MAFKDAALERARRDRIVHDEDGLLAAAFDRLRLDRHAGAAAREPLDEPLRREDDREAAIVDQRETEDERHLGGDLVGIAQGQRADVAERVDDHQALAAGRVFSTRMCASRSRMIEVSVRPRRSTGSS